MNPLKIIKPTKNLNNILSFRRNNKFNHDKLDYELAVAISGSKLKNLQNNKNLTNEMSVLSSYRNQSIDLISKSTG